MLDTESYESGSHDGLCYPQTPALSVAGSAISSPGDMLSTPMNPMFSGLDHGALAMKEDVDAQEQFPHLDWHHCAGSPPMTPCKYNSSVLSNSKFAVCNVALQSLVCSIFMTGDLPLDLVFLCITWIKYSVTMYFIRAIKTRLASLLECNGRIGGLVCAVLCQ